MMYARERRDMAILDINNVSMSHGTAWQTRAVSSIHSVLGKWGTYIVCVVTQGALWHVESLPPVLQEAVQGFRRPGVHS